MSTRILLVDDHEILCEGLRLLLQKQAGMTVVGRANSGSEALALAAELSPDLIVMDISLGDADGLVISKEILKNAPGVQIIILSAIEDPEIVNRAIQCGVRGYVLKASDVTELIHAIRIVMGGNPYLCPEAVNAVLQSYKSLIDSGSTKTKPLLSDREREVLKMTASGLRVKDIATKLDISIKTVDTHRSHILQKLGCKNAAELTRYAIREGIIPP